VARRIVLSDDALAVAVPILEEVLDWDREQIRSFLESAGFLVREWDKLQTDTLILRRVEPVPEPVVEGGSDVVGAAPEGGETLATARVSGARVESAVEVVERG